MATYSRKTYEGMAHILRGLAEMAEADPTLDATGAHEYVVERMVSLFEQDNSAFQSDRFRTAARLAPEVRGSRFADGSPR